MHLPASTATAEGGRRARPGPFVLAFVCLCALAAPLRPAAAAAAPDDTLRVGVGRADITPPTGFFMQGWVRSDAVLRGQHTRLFARAIVLERGGRKFALVAADLNSIAGGMLEEAANSLSERGFSERNVLTSASHTHAAPSGFYNFPTYNTVFMAPASLTDFNLSGGADPKLYAFMVRRLAAAIRRADDDLGPGRLGWGRARIEDLTANRSLEAHLADHGILLDRGDGVPSQDPKGRLHTINPRVDVLRVDKRLGDRWVPIGMWSTFANHGTVNPYTFDVYNADHHGSATRVVEDAIRESGEVPPAQMVVNAYGNTDEGDQSSALHRRGPAFADYVGRVEAEAMLAAWRDAESRMTDRPALDWRWTRLCFCGQETEGGRVADSGWVGLSLITGSEEGRGPLHSLTGAVFEGLRSPFEAGAQGHKIPLLAQGDGIPKAVPLLAVRIADRLVVSVPGEMTAGMGERVRDSVLEAAAGAGVQRAVISGLANEYLSYFTTPEEYERQHYEGGSTLYGRYASNLLKQTLVALSTALAAGEPAPAPYEFDPRNGLTADAEPYGPGAAAARTLQQPDTAKRLAHAEFRWRGGPRGLDRPLDAAFVHVERRGGDGWTAVADDLGLQIVWRVKNDEEEDSGDYTALWEVPPDIATGGYRFRVTGNRYQLISEPFAVVPADTLTVIPGRDGGDLVLQLAYPPADPARDFTFRPEVAAGGTIEAEIDGEHRQLQRRGNSGFVVPETVATATITVPEGAACDGFGNCNGEAVLLHPRLNTAQAFSR